MLCVVGCVRHEMERLKGEVWRTVWGLGFLVVLPVESKSLRSVSRTFAAYVAIKY